MKLTADEFKVRYCNRSKISIEFFDLHMVVLPCCCGDSNCTGWAAVSIEPDAQRRHTDLYGPQN